jgi:hypothetical protein
MFGRSRPPRPRDGLSLWVRSSHDVDAKAAVLGCCARTNSTACDAAALLLCRRAAVSRDWVVIVQLGSQISDRAAY